MAAKKIIKVVVVTGADDSIRPEALISIAERYPFVEFGILLSKKQQGRCRFPSRAWLEELYILWRHSKITLSGHLCAGWVRDLCLGDSTFFNDFRYIRKMFQRFQLNFHAEPHSFDYDKFRKILRRGFDSNPVIFQMDGVHDGVYYSLKGMQGIQVFRLFDLSGGTGVLPETWPKQSDYCGYAGGLSPDNAQNELEKISRVADGPIWIDAETKLRSPDDSVFRLDEVCRFLEAARPWVIGD